MLITSARLQRADSIVRKARLVVYETFAVCARSRELNEDDRIVVTCNRVSVVRRLRVNQDAKLLVKVDIARRDVVE